MEPKIVKKRALDVTPYLHGIWCRIEDGEPFVNQIASRKWSEDGKVIWFMLDSHNFDKAAPDDLMEVVEIVPSASPSFIDGVLARDAAKMAVRPTPKPPVCPTCGQPKGGDDAEG